MSIYLNRVTLKLYGGAEPMGVMRRKARFFLNRMLMAKKIGKALEKGLGKKEFSVNGEFINRMEKKLRFLEVRDAIKISKGKIYYTSKAVELGDEGRGRLDIIATFTRAALNSYNGKKQLDADQLRATLNLCQNDLFARCDELKMVEEHLPNRLRALFFHPVLDVRSLEDSAAHILRGLNRHGADDTRHKIVVSYPETEKTIQFIEQEISRLRQVDINEIKRSFDPKSMEPFTMTVYPTRDFSLVPEKQEGFPRVALVISDVHLDIQPHPRTDDLLRFYNLARHLKSAVVHNGDYYDLFVWRAAFFKIQEANRQIMNALNCMPRVLQIWGNHDSVLAKMAGSTEKFSPNTYLPENGTFFDGKVYIEHGHQSDRHRLPELKRGQIIVYILSYLSQFKPVRYLFPEFLRWADVLERLWFEFKSLFTRSNEWKIYRQDAVLERIRTIFSVCSEERGKMGLSPFSKEDPMLYIRGHDHTVGFYFTFRETARMVKQDPLLAGKVLYVNSGSWRWDDADFLAIDYGQKDRVFVYPFVWRPTYDHFVAFREQMKQS